MLKNTITSRRMFIMALGSSGVCHAATPLINFDKSHGALIDVDKSGRGLGIRSNRYTMFVDNMKIIKIQEEADTGSCEISAAENFFKLI